MSQMTIVLLIFLAVVVVILTNKVSIPAACMMCAVLLEVTGVLNAQEAWAGLANTSVVMMASMFIVAGGFGKTSVLQKISLGAIKPGSSDRKILFTFAIMIFMLGCFTNAAGTCAIMFPLIYQVCKAHERPVSKFIYPCCALATLWAGTVPLGGNSGSYIGYNTVIEQLGGQGTFDYFTMFFAKLPIAVLMTALVIWTGTKFAPVNPEADAALITVKGKNVAAKLSPMKEKIAVVIFVATVLGVIVCAITGISVWKASCLGALAMCFSGVIEKNEAPKHIAWPVIFIFVGMLPLSTALNKTGGDVVIANIVTKLLGGTTNSYVIMGVIFLITSILTQLMSNTAVGAIFRPLAALIAIQAGFDARACMLAAMCGSSSAFLLPTASPHHAMGFDAGKYTIPQYVRCGLLNLIAYFVLFMIWVPLIYPCS